MWYDGNAAQREESLRLACPFSRLHSRSGGAIHTTLVKAAADFRESFIQDDHAEVNSTIYSSAWSINACMANRTASAITSVETLPHHSSTIASQAIPLATCS